MEFSAIMASPVGNLEIIGTETALEEIRFLGENGKVTDHIPQNLQEVVRQLNEYFSGNRKIFDVDLKPSGTDFQKRVWNELQHIPYGETISYAEMAKRLGNPKVIRAAASANGKNPIPIIIPCHRVIGSDGSLTGFSGGLERKKWLFEHENPPVQQLLFSK